MIHDAEGTSINHESVRQFLITVITVQSLMILTNEGVISTAFVSVSENVHILGRFVVVEN